MKTALIYGTCTGNTEVAAELIRDEIGAELIDYFDVSEIELQDLTSYDLLIIGCSTWDIGELQYDWSDVFDDLDDVDLTGTLAVFFGMGDQAAYADTYQDAIGMLHDKFAERGAKVGVGYTDPSGDKFEDSKALREDGRFCGLALDQDCQPAETEPRVTRWVAQLREELDLPVPAGT